jgi:hypothetical protein
VICLQRAKEVCATWQKTAACTGSVLFRGLSSSSSRAHLHSGKSSLVYMPRMWQPGLALLHGPVLTMSCVSCAARGGSKFVSKQGDVCKISHAVEQWQQLPQYAAPGPLCLSAAPFTGPQHLAS